LILTPNYLKEYEKMLAFSQAFRPMGCFTIGTNPDSVDADEKYLEE
jgi:hypothetical protein